MKFINFSKALNSKKGEIGTIVVLIGMAVIGLGILFGSQIRDGRINFLPRATAAADPIWAGAKAAPGNIYPWTNGGPTTGWESYFGKRVYICNGNYCWTLERATPTGPVTWVNNGNPFNIQTEYSTLKPAPNGVLPWSGNGPTSAWTWELPNGTRDDNRLFPNVSKETIINETMLCNGTYCWRHVRTATDGTGFWRDGDDADTIQGDPIRMDTRDFWKDKPGLYTNNGPTVGWNDPVNKKATLCNEGYCESVSYGNGWVWAGTVSPFPSGKGVTKYTAAWTSPANIISLCTFNSCWPFTLSSGGGSWGSDSVVITPPATAICIPTLISPARSATVTSNPTFVWSACPGASVKYRIEVMGNATPSTVLFVGTSYSFTSPIPTWVAGRTYTWKVKACPNADCMGGTFSSESQFIYNTAAPVATNTKAPVATNSPTPRPPTNTPTPRPATNSQALWDQIKPIAVAGVNIYPWTSGGPTAGWESPSVNRAYICNGKYCWVLDRNTLSWVNGGLPFNTETEYSTLKASTAATGGPKTGVLPWSEKGITSAWTWNVAYQGGFVDETVLCNGNYCWRHLKMPNNAAGSGWRDNGNPIYLPTYGNTGSVWTDTRVAALWTGNGITVAWTDPVNGRATLCNRGDCRSLDYKNWQWRFNGAKITPFPAPANSGVTEYTSAWTSPATNVISLCNANRCWLYDINASGYAPSSIIFSSNVATPTIQPCIPTLRSPARSASVTSNPTFEWSACPGASVKYRIEVVGNATPSTVLFVGTRYSFTSPIPTWVAGRTYTWKVKACPNADCIGGTFSSESSFTYISYGSLKINITAIPSSYQHPNMKWRRATTATWNAAGATENNVSSGTYTIEFQTVAGFNSPANVTGVAVTSGQSITKSGTYSLKVGSIKINIPTPIPAGAQWRRVATPEVAWRNSGTTEPSVASGDVSIEFKSVAGYTKPVDIIVSIPNGGVVEKSSAVYVSTCKPTLTSPSGNASVTSNPTFVWSACPGNGKYRVEVTGDAAPSAVLFVGTSYSFTSPIPTWVAGRTYTWKVKACPNADCIGGEFSPGSSFTYNTVSVPTKWTLTLSAVCTDTKAVLNPDYGTLWRWNDGSTAAATQGTAQPVIINGAASKTYSIQLRGNQSLVVKNATVIGMTKGTDNTLTWTSTTLPAGAHSIAYVAEASACKVPDSCPRKREGDANCNGVVDTLDAVCWVGEARGHKPEKCISADFNSNGIVSIQDLLDISLWRSTMIKEKSTR